MVGKNRGCALGVNLLCKVKYENLKTASGTSFSAPLAAGAAAVF
ncbi:MAG: hypothetical protein Ct9H90mP3_8070 [Flammeovirgaceae bacterium]|nr:MAG: hypothetical protein Ct9H90mP3_8070 [Flammeovirgaceae bacterium]